MQINTQEINGYLIEDFNQYDLEEGKAQGVCPLCSSDRKSQKQKLKCASYDWETGLGTCHNCDTTFQLHTYKRKGNSIKEYTRPVEQSVAPIESTKGEKWFDSRGISVKTLKTLKVSEGQEWMPQTNKIENASKFNYFIGSELSNIN